MFGLRKKQLILLLDQYKEITKKYRIKSTFLNWIKMTKESLLHYERTSNRLFNNKED